MLDNADVHLKWQCDDRLTGLFYSNDFRSNETGHLESKLNIKHLYRLFDEKSCSCYLVSNYFEQRLMHLRIYFQLYLVPSLVTILKASVNLSLELKENQPNLQLEAEQLIDLQCKALGSRPASNCKWSLLNGFEFRSKDFR